MKYIDIGKDKILIYKEKIEFKNSEEELYGTKIMKYYFFRINYIQ